MTTIIRLDEYRRKKPEFVLTGMLRRRYGKDEFELLNTKTRLKFWVSYTLAKIVNQENRDIERA